AYDEICQEAVRDLIIQEKIRVDGSNNLDIISIFFGEQRP
ncbi:unnamed protein product, partial [marine sediment metagenome]